MNKSNNPNDKYNIVEWTHSFIKQHVPYNGFYIDATAGRGCDTLFLCQMCQKDGHVLAFDIQTEAIESTKQLLFENHQLEKCRLIHDSHENMAAYAQKACVDLIMFNFGYLPNGNHEISTKASSSIKAVQSGLDLLKKGGLMSLLIYSGGDSGFNEKTEILDFLKKLDYKQFLVITNEYYNRPNNPPLPVFIFKLY